MAPNDAKDLRAQLMFDNSIMAQKMSCTGRNFRSKQKLMLSLPKLIPNFYSRARPEMCFFCVCGFRGRQVYEPPRYMSVGEAAQQLATAIQERRGNTEKTPLECKLVASLAQHVDLL